MGMHLLPEQKHMEPAFPARAGRVPHSHRCGTCGWEAVTRRRGVATRQGKETAACAAGSLMRVARICCDSSDRGAWSLAGGGRALPGSSRFWSVYLSAKLLDHVDGGLQ